MSPYSAPKIQEYSNPIFVRLIQALQVQQLLSPFLPHSLSKWPPLPLSHRIDFFTIYSSSETADEPNRIPQKINLGPMGRTAQMSEINSCINMLLQNDFITGEKIYLDGGRHIY